MATPLAFPWFDRSYFFTLSGQHWAFSCFRLISNVQTYALLFIIFLQLEYFSVWVRMQFSIANCCFPNPWRHPLIIGRQNFIMCWWWEKNTVRTYFAVASGWSRAHWLRAASFGAWSCRFAQGQRTLRNWLKNCQTISLQFNFGVLFVTVSSFKMLRFFCQLSYLRQFSDAISKYLSRNSSDALHYFAL